MRAPHLEGLPPGRTCHTWAAVARKLTDHPWDGGDRGAKGGEGSHHVQKPWPSPGERGHRESLNRARWFTSQTPREVRRRICLLI